MKLLRLELRAFGPFQDQRLDFTQDRPAVQLIYGPNEAGKSTALRAVHDLFYGIPERTGDAHRHRMSDLRIAALLRDARERELFVVRRKGNKDTLLDASGKPLPGAEASWITAGVAEPHFSSFFGLSYATLEHDAKDLLSGSGDLGESLFGAGLGGRAVRDVLTALAQESDAIYKRRGTTLPFNQAVSALDEAKRALRESAIDAKKFDTQQREILEAEQHDDALRKRREHLVKERSKLERARRVLPLFAERTRLQRELRLLGEVRWLPPEASAQRMQAQETVRLETLRIEQLDAELARLAEQRAALDVPEKLLALDAATMVALRDRIGSCKRARAELPGKRDAARAAREAVEHGAVALAGAASLAAEREAPYAALVRRIREHVVSRAALVADVERTERDLTRARAELRTLRGQQGQPLPARESVEQAAELQASIDHELAKLAEQERDCATRRARVEREIAALEAGATLPAESELHAARQRRDAVLEELASAGDARAREASLAALRPRIAQADRIADDLRREADRIASLAALRSELATCQREHAMVEDARAATHARLLRAQSDWTELWKATGITPRTPREMRRVVDEHHQRRAAIDALELDLAAREADLEAERVMLQRWAGTWGELMQRIGLLESAGAGDTEERLAALAAQRELAAEAAALAREVGELEREIESFERDVHSLAREHAPGEVEAEPEATAALLVTRYQRARDDRARALELDRYRDARGAERADAELKLRDARRRLDELMHAAGVAEVEALLAAEQRSSAARHLQAELAKSEAALALASDGMSLEDLANEVRAANADSVRVRLEEVNGELEAQEDEVRSASHELARKRAGLELMRSRVDASEAAARVAEQLTTIRGLGERYVQLRLAAAVLKQEVARYRDKHKEPILRSASALFARLTLDGFSGLEADYDAADEPVLACVRDDGARVHVAGLSQGTRDQLYLALRLASVRELAEHQELMPLVLDDILVHFDDARARAALAVLGEIAEVTQVLFFTHHARLCELARETLAERLCLHELPSPAAQRARTVA